MAVEYATGTFLKPAAPTTGAVAAAGVSIPFEPVALWLWSAGRLVNATYEDTRNFCQGVWCATGQAVAASNGLNGGSAGVTGNSSYVNDAAIMAFTTNDIFGSQLQVLANLDSIDALGGGNFGFTLDWTINGAGGSIGDDCIIHYVAWGGADITDVFLKGWDTSSGGTGTFSVTGVGFQPDSLFSIGCPNRLNGTSNGATGALMVANCQLQQWCVTNVDNTFSVDPAFPLVSLRQQTPDMFSAGLGFLGGIEAYARLTNMDADGWTYVIDVTPGDETSWFTLAFKGMGTVIGAVEKRTTVGTQTIPVSPMTTPVGMLLASYQDVASATKQNFARIGVGAYDGTAQGAIAAVSPKTTLTGYGGIDYNNADLVKINNLTSTVDALAVATALDSGGLDLNWTTNDAVATQLVYCIFGEGTTGTCAEAPIPPTIEPPIDWVWEIPDLPIPCICIPIINDEGAILTISNHCADCLPQPFEPALFADSERKSVRVPVQNNVIQTITNNRGLPMLLVNDEGDVLQIITTGLILSKHDVALFGHYLGWHVQGTDAPFRFETVEMQYAPTREWDTSP